MPAQTTKAETLLEYIAALNHAPFTREVEEERSKSIRQLISLEHAGA